MNKQEFRQEVEESKLSRAEKDEFFKVLNEYAVYQQLALDTLKEFHRICEKHNIWYQVTFGSLIGMIRDAGQVPWDYDEDVYVKYDEKDKLIQALKEDLSEDYYFYCPEVDPGCRHFIIRVSPKGYKSEALHVDVFYLVGLPDDAQERMSIRKKYKMLSRMRQAKLINISEEWQGKPKRLLQLCLAKFAMLFVPLSWIENAFHGLAKKYPMATSNYCCSADVFGIKRDFEKTVIEPTELKETEEGTFRIPVNYEKILNIYFRNYKVPFPLEARIKEVVNCYKHFKHFEK